MKYIKLFEDHNNGWSWPEEARLIELGLHEPDLFQCWTRIPHEPWEELDKEEVKSRLEGIAAGFGVQYQGSQNAGRSAEERFEFLWVGPVQGLKDFVDAARREFLPWDRILTRNWVRASSKWKTHEEYEWWSWFQKSRGIRESADPVAHLERLLDLGLVDPVEVGVNGLIRALFEKRYPELKFSWSKQSDWLKVTKADGTCACVMSRTAANRSRFSLAGDWMWRSWTGKYSLVSFTTNVLDERSVVKLAVDVYSQSTPFLDAAYRGETLIAESRGAEVERLRDLGLADEFADMDWSLDYEQEDAIEDEKRKCYSWTGPSGEHVTGVMGTTDNWDTDCKILLSNGSTIIIDVHISAGLHSPNSPRSWARVVVDGVTEEMEVHEWVEEIGDTGSIILPALHIYSGLK